MQKALSGLVMLLAVSAFGASTSTRSFTDDARGAHPNTLTYGSGTITVDMSALPDGVQVYRAILAHNRRGNGGSFPANAHSTQPLQVEASDEPGVWLATLPPRQYYLDCTAATQRAVTGNPKELVLNVVSFASLASSDYLRLDVWCDQAPVNTIDKLTGISTLHRDGDTMIAFTENPALLTDPSATVADYETAEPSFDAPDVVRYRIYRHTQAIDGTTIRDAELVDEIPPLSCWNPYYYGADWRSKDAEIVPRLPVDDGVIAAVDQGIYVRRASATESAYYAVSKAVNGEEDLSSWTTGQNRTGSSVAESAGTGMVLLRAEELDVDFQYVSNANKYYYVRWDCPPDYNVPNEAMDYLVAVPPTAADPRPVDVALHSWGATLNSGYGWWYEVEQGALLVATNQKPYDWWTAFHENRGTVRPFTDVVGNGGGRVRNYTEKRILSFLNDFVKANWTVDEDRILVTGSSMGGSGCVMWGIRQPDVFAYINGWVGVYIPRETPTFKGSFEGVYGEDAWDCEYESTGMSAFDYWDSKRFIEEDPGREVPFVCTANGKNDGAIGWTQAWKFITALQQARQPHKFVWGQSGHSQRAILPGESASDRYIGITIARNRSVPAFTNCSQDDDMGDGDPLVGDDAGYINRYLLWQTSDIVDVEGTWAMTVHLIAASPLDACTVDITPRRCQYFAPAAATVCDWSNTDVASSNVIESSTAVVDAYGLVTLTGITVSKTKNRIEITHSITPTPPAIVSPLAASGVVGESFSYVIQATGTQPITYDAVSLPSWALFDQPSHTIGGTPDAAGDSTVQISATNAYDSDLQDLVITITSAPEPPVITSGFSASATVGEAFSYAVVATGDEPITYGATNLPAWASFDSGTGVISGTPDAAGTHTVQISATNVSDTDAGDLVITVSDGAEPVHGSGGGCGAAPGALAAITLLLTARRRRTRSST